MVKYAKNLKCDGFIINGGVGGNFTAFNNDICISFVADGRNGGLYWMPKSYFDKTKKRNYTAQRYLYKYIGLSRKLAECLFQNNCLWDYKTQEPLKDSMLKAKRKENQRREKQGKCPLYEID